MSTIALSWALNAHATGRMAAETRLVLAALADYAGADHQAWPSALTLSHQLDVSVRSVRRHLAALEALGLITRGDQELVAHYRADRRPVVWRLDVPETPRRAVTHPSPRPTDGVTPVTQRGDSGGSHGVTAPSPKPRTNPPTKPTTPQPPASRGGQCPAHTTPAPSCRACGTSPRAQRRAEQLEAAETERAGRVPLCERCGIRHPGDCLELIPPPSNWRTPHLDPEPDHRADLAALHDAALPADAPGAWIRAAIESVTDPQEETPEP